MAGDWIKMTTELHEKPEVAAMSDTLGLDEYGIVGRLHRIWSWFSEHTEEGAASGITSAFIDRLVARPGFADAMTAVGWLQTRNGSLAVPTWDRHNSQSAKTRALTRDRVKRSRNDVKRTSSSLLSSDPPPDSSEGGPGETVTSPMADFAAFWRLYPLRKGKGQAERAWERAARTTAPTLILEAAREYAASPDGQGQFCPHASTWLNGKKWADDRWTWWGKEPLAAQKERSAWIEKDKAISWWATLTPEEQKQTTDSIMELVRNRPDYDPIRQAWERDHAAGRCERFAVEAHKRKGKA